MATWYVDSTVPGSPNDGTSWDTAVETFAEGIALASAGDDIWIASDHNEVTSSTVTYTVPGTVTSPTRVFSVNSGTDAYEPASARQIDATTSTYDITVTGFGYFYGVWFACGDDFTTGTNEQFRFYEDCRFELTRTSGGIFFTGAAGGSRQFFRNCTWDFENGNFNYSSGTTTIEGGVVNMTGTPNNFLFAPNIRHSHIHVKGLDISSYNPGNGYVSCSGAEIQSGIFERCILHPSATLFSGTPDRHGNQFLFIGCDDATDNNLWRMEMRDKFGDVTADSTVYRVGGAAEDGTNISWRVDTNANAIDGSISESIHLPPIEIYIGSAGQKTFTINCIWDSQIDAQNDEIWMDLEYQGSTGNTSSAYATDRVTVLGTPANHTTNSETWTQPDGSPTTIQYPNQFQLSVTATPQRAGIAVAHVYVNKPSTTFWVDPLIVVS